MRSWLLLSAVLLPGGVVAAGHEVSVGSTALVVTNGGVYNPKAPYWGLEATYTRALGAWDVGAGVRLSPGAGSASLPMEAYARALLTPRLGLWVPAVGPEVGLSGLPVVLPPNGGFPEDLSNLEEGLLGPAYVAFHAAPLRFAWRGFTASALELQWGTTLGQPGATLRLQLGLLRVGVAL
jgi:hypothetical protein